MFEEAAKIGGLEIQLSIIAAPTRSVPRLGSPTGLSWLADALHSMRRQARPKLRESFGIFEGSMTREKVDAAIFVGDAVEEIPGELYDAASGLAVPVFLFQEGDGLAVYVDDRDGFVDPHPPQTVEQIFREIARLSNGAYAKFDAGAAAQLGELLRAIAAFAVGGLSALSDLRTDAARKLIAQLK